ncbi:nuclease-related domain protein [Clostridioides difficile CD160]|nr:nuclease-related domain protein [Clostridioides difficile CD160]
MNNKEKGDFGEEIAVNYLLAKGAKILEKNYRLKLGEIDIIANIGNEIVFVEVKSRSNIKYGYPCESVGFKKRKKIVDVAKYYIIKNNLYNTPIRFDIIEVYLLEKRVNHIINAF